MVVDYVVLVSDFTGTYILPLAAGVLAVDVPLHVRDLSFAVEYVHVVLW